jgi:hypothetical protein
VDPVTVDVVLTDDAVRTVVLSLPAFSKIICIFLCLEDAAAEALFSAVRAAGKSI